MTDTAQVLISRPQISPILVDVPAGFADTPWWGPHDNTGTEFRIADVLGRPRSKASADTGPSPPTPRRTRPIAR